MQHDRALSLVIVHPCVLPGCKPASLRRPAASKVRPRSWQLLSSGGPRAVTRPAPQCTGPPVRRPIPNVFGSGACMCCPCAEPLWSLPAQRACKHACWFALAPVDSRRLSSACYMRGPHTGACAMRLPGMHQAGRPHRALRQDTALSALSAVRGSKSLGAAYASAAGKPHLSACR